ncbi:hypothetical protein ISN76_19520 [Dyella halodurans]|uniref:DUF2384 domain-containing protein n=1 Tax=Dyella halodurans TaxID=1920171 RepID=A0ABV9BZX9_9GAMM|nr:hypothetical protein [Dyella halodurans]
MPAASPLSNVAKRDYLGFGLDDQFQPHRVSQWLGLEKDDVARIANIPLDLVRHDDNMPTKARNRLEEIAIACNFIAEIFDGDLVRTWAWFQAANPMLGDVSPRDMVRLGRFDRLRKFIVSALDERAARDASAD